MDCVAPFGLALVLLALIAWSVGRQAMIRTSFALLFNWCAQLAYYKAYGDSVPWAFNLGLDTITATIILVRPAGKMQALLGWTFIFQIAMHTAYGWNVLRHGYVYDVAFNYWKMLRNIAILQIAIMGVWFCDGLARRIFGGRYTERVPWSGSVDPSPDKQGVAQ